MAFGIRHFHPIHWVMISAIVMFPLAVLAPLGFSVLFPITAWGAFIVKFTQDRAFSPFPRRALLLLGGAHLWGFISLFWSIFPERTLMLSFSLLALSTSGIILWKVCETFTAQEKEKLLTALTVGFAIGIVLLSIEVIFDGILLKTIKSESTLDVATFNKATSVISIFIWPLVVANYLKGRRLIAGAFLILTVGCVFALFSDASKGALILGAIAFPFTYRFRRVTVMAAWGLFLFVLMLPLISQTVLKPEVFKENVLGCKASFIHRIYTWDFVSQQIRKRPLQGWGLDTARSEQFSTERFNCDIVESNGHIRNYDLPSLSLHPHNAAFQWWLELGIVGVLLMSFLVIQIPWALRQWSNKGQRAAALSSFTATTAIAFISYGIWQNWWISVLWLAIIYGHIILTIKPPKRT